MASGYGAAIEEVDFVHAVDASRMRINGWVEEQTHGKVRELLPENAVTSLTRLVVTNAVYFKGTWAHPFPRAGTRNAAFKIASGIILDKTVMAPMMNVTSTLRLGRVGGVQALELPYDASSLAMLIVLPDKVSDLARLEEALSVDALARWVESLSPRLVEVSLPKLSFEWGGDVREELKPPPPPRTSELRADHPFLFFIRDTNTGHILFAGRVTNPKA